MAIRGMRWLARWGASALVGFAFALLVMGCELPDEAHSADGATLFARHCASCHGANGDGSGPLAAELHKPPANLRTLAQRNGGKFDEGAVMASIDGRRAVASHGPRDMPVWGAVFESELEERGERTPHYTTLLRARLLADYVRTLQD